MQQRPRKMLRHAGIGMLACQRLGVPQTVTDLKLKILDRIAIYTRSAFGLSPTKFGNLNASKTPTHRTDEAPTQQAHTPLLAAIYGILQGTQDAGAIWLSLWTVLYAILNTILPGLQFSSADFSNSAKQKSRTFCRRHGHLANRDNNSR